MRRPEERRALGAASVPGLHWPPEKPTATTPRWSGWERNLEGMVVVGAVEADIAGRWDVVGNDVICIEFQLKWDC